MFTAAAEVSKTLNDVNAILTLAPQPTQDVKALLCRHPHLSDIMLQQLENVRDKIPCLMSLVTVGLQKKVELFAKYNTTQQEQVMTFSMEYSLPDICGGAADGKRWDEGHESDNIDDLMKHYEVSLAQFTSGGKGFEVAIEMKKSELDNYKTMCELFGELTKLQEQWYKDVMEVTKKARITYTEALIMYNFKTLGSLPVKLKSFATAKLVAAGKEGIKGFLHGAIVAACENAKKLKPLCTK